MLQRYFISSPMQLVFSRFWRVQRTAWANIALLLLAGFSNGASADKLTKVIVEPVEIWDKGISTKLYCQVSTPFMYKLTSHAQAELTEILPVGSRVKKGQLLAQQDAFYLSRDIEIKKVDIQQAKTSLTYYQSEFDRLSSLRLKDMTSVSEHNQLKQQLQSAQLTHKRLQQELEILEQRFKRLHHYAPFYGQVVKLDAQLGKQLNQGADILTLMPLEHKQLECKLPLDVFNQVKDMRALSFQYDNHGLILREFSELLNEKSQNVTLFFDYDSSLPQLLIGQRLQLNMSQEKQNASRIPYDAVKLENDKVGNKIYSTWMVNQEDKAVKVELKILATSPTHFIVESQLKAGDWVVVRGSAKLKSSQKVTPVKKVLL